MGRFLRAASALAVVFLLESILRTGTVPCQPALLTELVPGRDSLTASINIRSGMYTGRGYLTGFQYSMLTALADSLDLGIGFSGVYEHRDCWQMLSDSLVDIVAVNLTDTVPAQYSGCVSRTMPFEDYTWVVRSGDRGLLYRLNFWLGLTVHTSEYEAMVGRFFPGRVSGRLSPYDEIIRRESSLLGWDWRLLAAVVYKESRFSLGARSMRGAVGLMQVRQSTAAAYGITDLFNPEENVRAGALYLRQIQQRYRKMGLDSVNVVKFTLAAYNAGESRVEDCINFTLARGRDFTDWETVAATIPLMAEQEHVEEADYLRHGTFRGRETIQYVRDVLSKYEEYRAAVAE